MDTEMIIRMWKNQGGTQTAINMDNMPPNPAGSADVSIELLGGSTENRAWPTEFETAFCESCGSGCLI